MQALVSRAAAGPPSRTPLVTDWLRHADATLAIVREHYGHLQGKALVHAAAEENVLVQLEHLRTLPVIAARISTGQVRLHGWMYKIDSGEVFYYESDVGQFVKFGDAAVKAREGISIAGRGRSS
jgi:carbonic anhydrase